MNLKEYFDSLDRGDYQRENFDDFLKKVSFSYSIPSIHIAGSNGKGTTANYLAHIYRAQGYKVGLFTSPALQAVNEMINIMSIRAVTEGIELEDDALAELGKIGAKGDSKALFK